MFEFYGYICPIINKQTDKQIMDVPPHNDNERFRRLSLLGALVGGKPTFLLSSIYVPNMYAICWG